MSISGTVTVPEIDIRTQNIFCGPFKSQISVSCHTWECEEVSLMVRSRTSHVTHMNELCHIYECAMAHMCMGHVVKVHVALRTGEYVMFHM